MPVKNTNYQEENIKLKKEIRTLRQQLGVAKQSSEAIQTKNIDALFIASEKKFKVYTEKTADKIYRILIEKMQEGAVTLTEDATILYCNSAFAHMVNLSLQKVVGTKFGILIGFSEKMWGTLIEESKNKDVKRELVLVTPEQKIIPVLMSMTALSIDRQHVLSVILTDLTIQNRHQEELKDKTMQLERKNVELENANKDLTSFTYASSHDLQEPLRKIQNFANYILASDEMNLSATGKEYFIRMGKAVKRMQTLIKDLLTYSETKNSERNFEKTDLGIIVDEVKKDFEDVIREKNATIEFAPLCGASIIRFQFHQLIQNLVSNSLKFMKPLVAPYIKIGSEIIQWSEANNTQLELNRKYCHITYTDNGIGFDSQYSERIFQVFQRLHSQEEYKGTGIGLAICKRIVENHHGVIYASGKLNEGARFDIYIPA